jgi:acyl-CoA thioester hydrolase
MVQHEVKYRVRYADTDKMGYIYYGHYPRLYEIGRVELLRDLGMTYQMLEDELEISMPVRSLSIKFVRSAYYDELITIKTSVKSYSEQGVIFRSEIFNEKGKLMNAGDVSLAFVNAKTMKGCPPPKQLTDFFQLAMDN